MNIALTALVSLIGAWTPAPTSARDSLASALQAARASLPRSDTGRVFPLANQFTSGDRTIEPGTTIRGPIAVTHGTLHVRGIVQGEAFAYRGDIVVHDGGEVRGNAFAMQGTVILDGGTVQGETRTLSGDLTSPDSSGTCCARPSTTENLGVVAGWLALLALLGLGILMFASRHLEVVIRTVEQRAGHAFLIGLAGQLLVLPVLVLLLMAFVLTGIGIFVIPLVIVGYLLVVMGLVTIGLVAIAFAAGRWWIADARGALATIARGTAFGALFLGIVLLMAPWIVTSVLGFSPMVQIAMATVAGIITWAAGTTGWGAALLTRGGTRSGMPATPPSTASAPPADPV